MKSLVERCSCRWEGRRDRRDRNAVPQKPSSTCGRVPEGKQVAPSYDFYFAKPTNDLSSKEANFNGWVPTGKADKGPNLQRPTKVGSYPPNKLGLYDMNGNVWQWCEDLYAPKSSGVSLRVIRGGCWYVDAGFCRAAGHIGESPDWRDGAVGFRLARVPLESK